MATVQVDLNADAGESFGAWSMGDDARLFPALSSVSVACGSHAGDPGTMLRTVRLAKEHGLAVGAHPGYPDLLGFGRRELGMSSDELYAAVLYQLGALAGVSRSESVDVRYVKPHGALHHRMVKELEAARAVARAVREFSEGLPLVVLAGPAGELMRAAAAEFGLPAVNEAFPERGYLSDGRLAPRSLPGAVITDPGEAAARALSIVTRQEVRAVDGGTVKLEAATLCVHGDNANAPEVAAAIREALEGVGVFVNPF